MSDISPRCPACDGQAVDRTADHVVPVHEIYSEGVRDVVATATEAFIVGGWKSACRTCKHRWVTEAPPMEKVVDLLTQFRQLDAGDQ